MKKNNKNIKDNQLKKVIGGTNQQMLIDEESTKLVKNETEQRPYEEIQGGNGRRKIDS